MNVSTNKHAARLCARLEVRRAKFAAAEYRCGGDWAPNHARIAVEHARNARQLADIAGRPDIARRAAAALSRSGIRYANK
jgi:hypothetical protein